MANKCYFTHRTGNLKTIRLLDINNESTIGIIFVSKSLELDSVNVNDLRYTSIDTILRRQKERKRIGEIFRYSSYRVRLIGFYNERKLIQFVNGEHGWPYNHERRDAISAGAKPGQNGYYWLLEDDRLEEI